jgi:hypothetical protein
LLGADKPWTPFNYIMAGAGATAGALFVKALLGAALVSSPVGWVLGGAGVIIGGYVGGKVGSYVDRPITNSWSKLKSGYRRAFR